MANFWVTNGNSAITAPTLGNVLNLNTIRIVGRIYWDQNDDGYWISQAGSTGATREFGIYHTTSLRMWIGGSDNLLGSFTSIFGATIIDGILDIEVDLSAETYSISLDGVNLRRNRPLSAGVGTSRVDGMLFRIGARGSTNSDSTNSTFGMGTGSRIGDVSIYEDGVRTRYYDMPTGVATNVPDTESSQDGTLQNDTGSDWTSIADTITIAYDLPIYASSGANSKFKFTGTYDVADSPVNIQYRVLDSGASTVIDWTSVDSFDDSLWDVTPLIPNGTGYRFDVRYSDGSETASITPFDIGLVFLFVGSSSAERPFTLSTGTLNSGMRAHIKDASWVTSLGGATISGESGVEFLNHLNSEGFDNIGIYAYGQSGSTLGNQWDVTTGGDYEDTLIAVEGNNISAVVSAVGYNDANNGDTLTVSQFTDFFNGWRDDISDVPVIVLHGQRNGSDPQNDAQFIALWQSSKDAIETLGNGYQVHRLDLEISGDTIHNTQDGANLYMRRIATATNFEFGSTSYYTGPVISSAQYNESDEVIVNLSTVDTSYTSISPSTGIEGFIVSSNGTPVTLSSAVVTNASTITLTSSSTLSAPVTVEFAGYEANSAPGNALAFTNYPTVNSSVEMSVTPIFNSVEANLQAPTEDATPSMMQLIMMDII